MILHFDSVGIFVLDGIEVLPDDILTKNMNASCTGCEFFLIDDYIEKKIVDSSTLYDTRDKKSMQRLIDDIESMRISAKYKIEEIQKKYLGEVTK